MVVSDGRGRKAAIFSPRRHYLEYPIHEIARRSARWSQGRPGAALLPVSFLLGPARANRHRRIDDPPLLAGCGERMRDLYAHLYLEKHARELNPRYRAAFFDLVVGSGIFSAAGWMGEDGTLEAFHIHLGGGWGDRVFPVRVRPQRSGVSGIVPARSRRGRGGGEGGQPDPEPGGRQRGLRVVSGSRAGFRVRLGL